MTDARSRSVALGLAWRTVHNVFTTADIVIPALPFRSSSSSPSRAACRSSSTSRLPFRTGYTAFQFVFVMLQSAAFGGVFTGFGIARDFEYGFARRLMIAAPYRSGLVVGYALSAMVRWAVVATMLTTSRSPWA